MSEAQKDWSPPLEDTNYVDQPIPSTKEDEQPKPEPIPEKKFEVFDSPNRYLNHIKTRYSFAYPFLDMDIGQGFFVPVEPNSNIDRLIAHLHHAVSAFHKQTSLEEKDEHGDDVLESVTTLPKKRTPDGTIQLDGSGNPIIGANHANRPKLIHLAQFVIKAAIKDDEIAEGKKAESDGALVIRIA